MIVDESNRPRHSWTCVKEYLCCKFVVKWLHIARLLRGYSVTTWTPLLVRLQDDMDTCLFVFFGAFFFSFTLSVTQFIPSKFLNTVKSCYYILPFFTEDASYKSSQVVTMAFLIEGPASALVRSESSDDFSLVCD